ncbi:hypothetical protein ABW21_db0207125 [Orbilia brochopaga]|nr:hypothetical protein ABW21_db0207125 [Drechslerella brochopaga]
MANTTNSSAMGTVRPAATAIAPTPRHPACPEKRLEELQKRFSLEYLAIVQAAVRRQGQAQSQKQATAKKPKAQRSKGSTTTASASRIAKSGAVSKPKARPTNSQTRTTKSSRRVIAAPQSQPSGVPSHAASQQENTANSERGGLEGGELAQENQTLSHPLPPTRAPRPVEVVLQRATGHFCPQTRQPFWYFQQRETWTPRATDTKRGQWWHSTTDSGQAVRYQILPGQGTQVMEEAWEDRRQALMYKVRTNRCR